MKNLLYFLIVSHFLMAIGCTNNPQPNNIVEQTHVVDSLSFTKDPSVSVTQNAVDTPCLTPHFTLEYKNAVPIAEIKSDTSVWMNVLPKSVSQNILPKKSQFFTFTAVGETIVKGAEGTTISIPSDCFETETGNILRSNSEKKAHFANVPLGEPVFIVATSPEDSKFNISVTETTISKGSNSIIELKTVEKDVFLRELHRLDSIKY